MQPVWIFHVFPNKCHLLVIVVVRAQVTQNKVEACSVRWWLLLSEGLDVYWG